MSAAVALGPQPRLDPPARRESNDLAPDWALRQLERAESEHPGRREGEIGISTLSWDPATVDARLRGEDVAQPSGSRLAKGTFLHWLLYGRAPFRETEVRIPIEGTQLHLVGHIDAADPRLEAVRDLKTTDRWDLSESRIQEVERQLGLYGYAMVHGEANAGTHGDPDWVPAGAYFGFTPRRALVDLWPAGEIEWGRLDLEGQDFEQLIEESYAWACRQVLAMVAGTWTPSEDQDASEVPDRAPEQVREDLVEAGQLKEAIDEAKPRYDQLRATIYENVEDSVQAGPYKAVYTGPSTETVLDVERARGVLEAEGEHLTDYQFTAFSVDVEDPAALAHVLEEFDVDEEIAGLEIDKGPALLEEKLRNRLAEAGRLEECTSERTRRSGYVSVRRLDDG